MFGIAERVRHCAELGSDEHQEHSIPKYNFPALIAAFLHPSTVCIV